MQDNYVYIMFSQTGTWFSTFLRYWTQTQYNHSSISFDPTLTDLYSFGRMSIKEKPWQGRFIVEGKNRGVFAVKPKTTYHVFKLAVSEQQLKKAKEIVSEFEREAPKYKYNIAGLPHVWLGIAWERKYHYFCSSFVAYVLEKKRGSRLRQKLQRHEAQGPAGDDDEQLGLRGAAEGIHRRCFSQIAK